MSGIVGVFHLDQQLIEESTLQKMLTAIAHRGPDRRGIWHEGYVGFGHVALHTTHEAERENQPCSFDGQVWITADARIDARDELKHRLELKGYPESQNATDVELLLYAYSAWGEACVEHLTGDFAFAIWDARQQTLFCARDHFGTKPFCYFSNDRVFIFASEPKAILQYPSVPHQINESRLADYLTNTLGMEDIDFTSTFFQHIFRLPPAHSLTVSPEGRTRIKRYWSLDAAREISYLSDAEYDAAFLELFEKSIQDRMRNPAIVGAMLSGGMDSSAIVGVARQHLAKMGISSLPTFSAISDTGSSDRETYYAGLVINEGGVHSHTIRPSQISASIDEMRAVLLQTDDLFAQWLDIPHLLYILARRQNLKVVLDGVDGDNVASHGRWYVGYLLQQREWGKALREARGSAIFYTRYNQSAWQILVQQGRSLFLPLPVRRVWRYLYNRRRYTQEKLTQGSIINPQFARQIGLLERKKQYDHLQIFPPTYTLRERAAAILQHPMITVALERYDRIAAAHSIEALHPFMDKRLVEYCLGLPWEQKVYEGWTKYILRRATRGLLPEAVRWRPGWDHIGLSFMQARFLHDRALMARLLEESASLIESYVNMKGVTEAYERFLKSNDVLEGDRVWVAVALIAWLRNYVVA